jgi:hypothetical protein
LAAKDTSNGISRFITIHTVITGSSKSCSVYSNKKEEKQTAFLFLL